MTGSLRDVVLDALGRINWPFDRDCSRQESDRRIHQATDAVIAALVEAGWGPTAARPDEDSGLTGPSPAGMLPRDPAALLDTPQHTITIGVEDGYPVMLMQCPFDMDDPERPCWSMDEVGHRDEFSTSCNWTDWWENTDDWPIEDFTITRGVEVADWTDYPRFVALAVTIDDAGASSATSEQVGQSGAALQETGGPTPPRCPTCGSDDPVVRRNRYWKNAWVGGCTDPWHAGQPEPNSQSATSSPRAGSSTAGQPTPEHERDGASRSTTDRDAPAGEPLSTPQGGTDAENR